MMGRERDRGSRPPKNSCWQATARERTICPHALYVSLAEAPVQKRMLDLVNLQSGPVLGSPHLLIASSRPVKFISCRRRAHPGKLPSFSGLLCRLLCQLPTLSLTLWPSLWDFLLSQLKKSLGNIHHADTRLSQGLWKNQSIHLPCSVLQAKGPHVY